MPGNENTKTTNSIRKLKKKINPLVKEMRHYPLVNKKPKDISKLKNTVFEKGRYDIMLSFGERIIMKLISLSFKIERKLPFIRRRALKLSEQIREDVIRSYLPFPPYSYAVLMVVSLFTSTLMVPVFFLFLALRLLIPAVMVGMVIASVYVFVAYLYLKPKRKFSGIRSELLQILGIWYGITTTGMSPQEQFEAIYEILLEYRRLNLKYGQIYPKFKLFDIFYDIHYAMKFKNSSVVDAIEETINKITDESLKLFFMKVLRAIKEQNDLSPVIETEYMRLVEEVEREIEKSGKTASMISEVYITVVSMFAGNLLILMIVMGSLTSFSSALHSIFMSLAMSTILVILATLGVGAVINTLFSSAKPGRKVPYGQIHGLFSFLAFLTAFIMPFITTVRTPIHLFIPPIIGLALSFPGYRTVKKVKKQIKNAEIDFAHRLNEIATQLSFGQMLPDAMLSTVLKVDQKIVTFSDWLFYTIANYLKFGRTMRDLIEPIFVKLPSSLIRIPLTVIALVEEKAGRMNGVFENMAIYVGNILGASIKVENYISQVKTTSVFINVASLGIIAYLLTQLLPSQLAVPLGSAFQGGSPQNFDINQIGQQYLQTYSQQSPFLFVLQYRLFPQTITGNPSSVTLAIGLVGTIVFVFSLVFAVSTSVFIVMLGDNPTLPEIGFYFSLFLLLFLMIGYYTTFSKIYNYQSYQNNLKIVKAFKQMQNYTQTQQ